MTNSEVLNNILFQLDRAQNAYQLYRENPVYLHACNIYKGNAAVVDLLGIYGGTFLGDLREAFLQLIAHLDVWMEQFHHLEAALEPKAETEFIFERFAGTEPFPAGVRQLIEEGLKKVG